MNGKPPEVLSNVELNRRGMHALAVELGPNGAAPFVAQFTTGLGDYTEECRVQYAGKTVADLTATIRAKQGS